MLSAVYTTKQLIKLVSQRVTELNYLVIRVQQTNQLFVLNHLSVAFQPNTNMLSLQYACTMVM